MKKSDLFINGILWIIIFSFSSGISAQDFPQWRGVNRDGNLVNVKLPVKWPADLKVQWKVMVGAGDATPVLSGNNLFIFTRQDSSEILRCLDSGSGKEIWRNEYQAITVSGPSAALHPGPRSTPVVADGKIFTLGVGGVLTCFDTSNGKQVWQKENTSKLVPAFFTGMSPIITEGLCIVHRGGKGTGEISAFETASGNEKWTWRGEGPSYSSPVLFSLEGKNQIVFVTEKNIVSLNPSDGKELWKVEYVPMNRFYNASTVVIDGQVLIISGQGAGTKAIKVQKQGDNFVTNEIWNNPDIGTKYCTPVINNGYLYGISDKRKMFCMNAGSGQTAWVDTTIHTDFGAFLNGRSAIIAIPGKTDLIVISPDISKYSEKAHYKVSDNAIYAHPLLSGKFIYIKDKESLIAYSTE